MVISVVVVGIVPYGLHMLAETEQKEVLTLMSTYVLHEEVLELDLSMDSCIL